MNTDQGGGGGWDRRGWVIWGVVVASGWADCFREGDLNEAAVRRTRSRVLCERLR